MEERTADTEVASGGYIKLFRTLQDASFAARPEYMAAWVHILLLATHKPRRAMIGSKPVALTAGQFVSGRKALASAVGVTEKQMRGILDFFESEGMITRESSRMGTVFTVCKYSFFNEKEGQEGPTVSGQRKGQAQPSNGGASSESGANEKANKGPKERATTQEHNIHKDTDVSFGSSAAEPTPQRKPAPRRTQLEYPKEFAWIWDNRPRREGSDPKRKAYQACNARIKQGATWRELAEGLKRYRTYCQTKGILNTEFVKQMATFFGPDEHYKNDWTVNHGSASASINPVAGGRMSTVDRQHAAAAAFLAQLEGEQEASGDDGSVVASYE